MSPHHLLLISALVLGTWAGIYGAGRDVQGSKLCWSTLGGPEDINNLFRCGDSDDPATNGFIPALSHLVESKPDVSDLLDLIYPPGTVMPGAWWQTAAITFLYNLGEEKIPFPTRVHVYENNKGISFTWPDRNFYVNFFFPVEYSDSDYPTRMGCGHIDDGPNEIRLFGRFRPMTEYCEPLLAGRPIVFDWD